MDMSKKVTKGEHGLADGEQLLGTVLLNPLGTTASMGGGAAGGLVGHGVGALMANRKKKSETERLESEGATSDGMAATFPTGRNFLSVTDRRWVVHAIGTMSGKAKGLTGEFAHGDITGLNLDKGKLSSKLVLRFSDGGQLGLELPRGSKVDEFLAAAAGAGAPQL